MAIVFDESVTTNLDQALRREWLETNGLGGWASSTLVGANTRRYHGLLVAALRPPVERRVLLSKLDETLVIGGARFDLGCNRYPGTVHPAGHRFLRGFRKDLFPEFEIEAGGVRLRKTIAAIHGENTTVVQWEVLQAPAAFSIELRAFLAFRDYHALTRANAALDRGASFEEGILRLRPYEGMPELFLSAPGSAFTLAGDWYFDFEYDVERERGLDHREDLFSPGVLSRTLRQGDRLGVIASTSTPAGRDASALLDGERRRRERCVEAVQGGSDVARSLALAADQFIVRRGERSKTIVAGYPWFTDWGRDTMIALPGLCLATGRLDDARSVLSTFARSADRGMLPNRFPDAGEAPEYNTVDATLWFFVASYRYLEAGGDEHFVLEELLPVMREIVAWHDRGTRHGIRVDADGLLTAGEPGVQLTWMDAKVGDWVVTPRQGKAVEINALWFNALSILGELEKRAGGAAAAKSLAARAKKVKTRFEEAFWNADAGCLFDVIDGDRKDPSIRPNQIFALCLPFTPLSRDKARAVLQVVERDLVTPFGLRSLAPSDPAYRPVYLGAPADRDGAYHQGTVWSWLLGPWASALVKTLGVVGKPRARAAIAGILPHLADAGIGTISEIFDAEPPHAPRGCIAQAWSVGELYRVWKELEVEPPATTKTETSTAKKSYKVVTPKVPCAAGRRGRGKTVES